jgi:hypothetical protein
VHTWEYNIKMDLQEIGWNSIDYSSLAQDRDRWWALVSAVTKGSIEYKEFLD